MTNLSSTLFDSSFAHDYTVAVDPEPSGQEELIEFPRAGRASARSLLVSVQAKGRPGWVGVFRGGRLSRATKTGVYTWPSPGKICVVCAGSAYLVEVHTPQDYEELGAGMVVDVLPLPDRNTVVMTDPWEVWAYGAAGLLWSTGRIAIDGLRVTDVRDGWLEGTVASFEDDDVPFQVDLETGRVTGGLRLR